MKWNQIGQGASKSWRLTVHFFSHSLAAHKGSFPVLLEHTMQRQLVGSHWGRLCTRPLCGDHSRLGRTPGVVAWYRMMHHHTAGCGCLVAAQNTGLCIETW